MHRNAPLTEEGRRRLCERVASGWSVAAAAESMNMSRQSAHKWWRRFNAEGAGSSRPLVSAAPQPEHTPARLERQVMRLRQRGKFGPARLGPMVGLPPSTVHKVLVRNGMNRLKWMDRPTGRVVRRIPTDHVGELVHVDVKKLAKIPPGGGHKVLGPSLGKKNKRLGTGYANIHSAIDAQSRIAYSEILEAESEATCVGFLARANVFFAGHAIEIERVLSDNGNGHRSKAWAELCAELGIRHTRTKPYHPQTNGKAERHNRTLLDEWAHVRPYRSDAARARTLDAWLHRYNHHRHHTAIGGAPMSRVTNVSGQHT
jgi:transposase-like protein